MRKVKEKLRRCSNKSVFVVVVAVFAVHMFYDFTDECPDDKTYKRGYVDMSKLGHFQQVKEGTEDDTGALR